MDSMNLDAFVYPGWGNPPRLIGDLSQAGNTDLGAHFYPPCMHAVGPMHALGAIKGLYSLLMHHSQHQMCKLFMHMPVSLSLVLSYPCSARC